MLRNLGLGIVRLRRRKGWSRAVLAERLGVKRNRLGKWELGVAAPSLECVVALLDALEVTFEELAFNRATPEASPLPPGQRSELASSLNRLLRVLRPLVKGKE